MKRFFLFASVITILFTYSYANQAVAKIDSIVQVPIENAISSQQHIETQSVIDFLQNTWGTLNFWIIASLLAANLVIYIYNIFLPFKLKKKEKELEKYKLNISKKLQYIENIHSLMCEISDNIAFVVNTQNDRIARLTKMNTYSGMYLKSETKNLIEHFIDAAISRDIAASLKYREQFEDLYRTNEEL